MNTIVRSALALILGTAMVSFVMGQSTTRPTESNTTQSEHKSADDRPMPEALNFKMQDIEGHEFLLAEKYRGKVVMFVNTASKCGLTPQYQQLQQLHDQFAEEGLAVVGVPCNQFGGQEPGTQDEIQAFCQTNYGVEFDLLSKVDVNGEKQCALYKYLNGLDLKPKGAGDVTWNFEKYILDRKGNPIARFDPRTKPIDPKIVELIKRELQK